jgi:AcrR family transcriptional regulator
VARKSSASNKSPKTKARRQLDRIADQAHQEVAKRVDEVVTRALVTTAKKIEAKVPGSGLADSVETFDFWTRGNSGSRKPKLHRDEIAIVALRIADEEGFESVSMRRIASELEVGTMTLYHYLRTKDDLLTLLVDAMLGEMVFPDDQKLPKQWKTAMTLIAKRTRDVLRKHPWVLDISNDPRVGPNAMSHFDQCWRALDSLDASFREKVELLAAVDDYVFGYCLLERTNRGSSSRDSNSMVRYIEHLIADGNYPSIARLTAKLGVHTVWNQVLDYTESSDRFDRSLARLLAGFEASFKR